MSQNDLILSHSAAAEKSKQEFQAWLAQKKQAEQAAKQAREKREAQEAEAKAKRKREAGEAFRKWKAALPVEKMKERIDYFDWRKPRRENVGPRIVVHEAWNF